jgi:ABC-2 type transport system permease protein
MILKFLLEKEVKQFVRNPFLPKLVLAFPIVVMLVLPWVMTMDVKNIRVIVVDDDKTTMARKIIQNIDASNYFQLLPIANDYHSAIQEVEQGNADVVVEIPHHFEYDFITNNNANIAINVNTVNGTKGLLGSQYLAQIFTNYNATINLKPPIQTFTQYRYNQFLDYKALMIPALMIIILIILCGFLPALNIVGEKETGTIAQINVTPVPKTTFILAKLIPYWIMGLIVFTVCIILAALVYNLKPVGNILLIYLCAILFILTISGFGLVVSNYSNNMQQALFVMFFFVMIFQLMSGLLTPIQSMPNWAQWITLFNPPRYFVHIIRSLYLKGGNLNDHFNDLAALAGFVTLFSAWAVVSYKKQ